MTRIILVLLTVFTLAACAPIPTYEELEAEAKATGDSTRLDRFEATVKKADAYYENKAACRNDSEFVWVCRNYSKIYRNKREPKNIDEYVRRYRNERASCGCATSQQLREAMQKIGY